MKKNVATQVLNLEKLSAVKKEKVSHKKDLLCAAKLLLKLQDNSIKTKQAA